MTGPAPTPVPPDAGALLLPLARDAIRRAVGTAEQHHLDPGTLPAWTREEGASFVTLHLDGRLRGCIGTVSAYRPLGADVSGNARAAALDDPRFPAVGPDEVERIDVEVSVLSTPEPVPVTTEADLAGRLRPGVDGVILQALGRRGTYLPQVWEQVGEPEAFVRSLKAKAGLPQGYWGDDVRVWRYGVTAWEDRAPR